VEKGYTLNIAHSNIRRRRDLDDPGCLLTWILLILTGLIFIALVLGFLYLVYGKEESSEEEA